MNNEGKKNILVIGDVILDEYKECRIGYSNNEEVETLKITNSMDFLGGAANVAANANAMGANVYLASVIGEDDAAIKIKQLINDKFSTELIVCDFNRETTKKTRINIPFKNNQNFRMDIDTNKTLTKSLEVRLLDLIFEKLPKMDCIIISDYNQGVITETISKWTIKYAKRSNVPVLVDSKKNDLSVFKNATTIMPNMLEFSEIINEKIKTDEIAVKYAQEKVRELNLDYLILKNGEKGGILITKEHHHITPPLEKKMVSPIGAGDSMIAGIAVALASGYTYLDAFKIGIVSGSCAINKDYTSIVNITDLRNSLNLYQNRNYIH